MPESIKSCETAQLKTDVKVMSKLKKNRLKNLENPDTLRRKTCLGPSIQTGQTITNQLHTLRAVVTNWSATNSGLKR